MEWLVPLYVVVMIVSGLIKLVQGFKDQGKTPPDTK